MNPIYENNIIFVPFEIGNFYAYKDKEELILEYPINNIGKKYIQNFESSNKLPTIGFIYIYDSSDSSKKVPFAGASIKKIILPDEISNIISIIVNEKKANINQTYLECFDTLKLNGKFDHEDSDIVNWIRKFLEQKLNDSDISEAINKKRFVWIICDILEYYTSAKISQDFNSYLQPFTPICERTGNYFNNSLAFYVPKKDYLDFRIKLRKSNDYTVGEEVRNQAIINLKKDYVVNNYQLIFRNFDETAWRDLLIDSPLNYISNEGKNYKYLFHLILEKKLKKEFNLYRSGKEIKWKYEDAKETINGSLDGYFELIDDKNIKYRMYLEFKNFDNVLEKAKDIKYQPLAIKNRQFNIKAYNYDNDDEWRYIAITKGTSADKLDKNFNPYNYIDLSWGEIFKIIVTEIYPMAIESVDKRLKQFIDFLIE